MTHTHPSAWSYPENSVRRIGNSFNEDDILMAVQYDLAQMRAVAGVMGKYDELIFEVICLGIHNKRGNMPRWFRDVLKDNCTWEDLYVLFNAVTFRLNSNSFFNTITALGVVSPLGEEEIIALQRNSESWSRNRKAASCS